MWSFVELSWKYEILDFTTNLVQWNRDTGFVNRWIVFNFCLDIPKICFYILTVGILKKNNFWSPAKREKRAKRNSHQEELRWVAQSCAKPISNWEEVHWAPRRPANWKLQVINMSLAWKTQSSLSSSPKNVSQTLKPYFSPPKTTGGRREPPLLAVEPPHQEKHFNRSER